MPEIKNLTIICPFLNEEHNLENFYYRLKKTLTNINTKIKYQIVFINDGSTDGSANIINTIKKNDKTLHLINFTKNFGQQKAILAGLENFNSDFYLTLDTDLQVPPEIIIDLINNIYSSHYQVVQAISTNINYEGAIKKKISLLFYKVLSFLSENSLKNSSSDYWIITKKIRDLIINDMTAHNFIRGFVNSTGYETLRIEFTKQVRIKGKSKYNLFKQIELGLNGIYLNFSKMYVFVFLLSLIIFLFGFIYFVWILISYFKGNTVPGWTSLALMLTIISTIIIITNSIIIFFLQKIISIVSKQKKYIIK